MKGLSLVCLSTSALTCLATNTTSEKIDAEPTSSTSTANGAIGDYVAAGIGISTHELTSALTAKPSNDLPETTSSSSQFLTFPNNTATLAGPRASDNVSNIADNVTSTSVADCWHSWLDYWSASSLNIPEYTRILDATTTIQETITDFSKTTWVTSSWTSQISTWTVYETSTLYSENYPISVSSSSYTTYIFSTVGWDFITDWSTLSEHYTTRVYNITDGTYRSILVGSTTALPSPSCELPATLAECSEKWSIKIFDALYSPTPDCTQVRITGDWCTAYRSRYLTDLPYRKFITKGHNDGWTSTDNTSYFPASQTLAPGCTLGCQACSITGETVQLYYWPPETATLVENGTETATLTALAQNGSSIRTAVIDGTALTSPTVYISYDILYASDSCSAVGKTYRNTILPLSSTNHLFSVVRLDPPNSKYRGVFGTSSFNLMDLIEPIPDDIYNNQFRCLESRWKFRSSNNATFSCARTAPYAPIIEVPPEARGLDPAWRSCHAWYGGLFDPPKALQPADALVVPTLPPLTTATLPAATPKPTLDSGLPTKTSPAVTSSPRPQAAQSEHAAASTIVVSEAEAEDAADISGHASRIGQTQVSPSDSVDDPADASRETTRGEASFANEVQDPVATSLRIDTRLDSSDGVAAILSMLLTKGSQGTDIDRASQIMPPSDSKSQDEPGVATSVGSEVHAATIGSYTQPKVQDEQGAIFTANGHVYAVVRQSGSLHINGAPASDSGTVAISGDVLTIGSNAIEVDGKTIPFTGAQTRNAPAVTKADIVIAGDTMAAFKYGDDVLVHDTKLTLGQVTLLDGTQISVASDGIAIGTSKAAFHGMDASMADIDDPITIDGRLYSTSHLPSQSDAVLVAGYTISRNGLPATIAGHMITYGSNGLFGIDATAPVIIDGTVYSASSLPDQPGVVLFASQTLSQGRGPVNINGQTITYGPNGISAVDPAESATATATTDHMASVLTIDGTAYTATPVSGRTGVVALQGQTLSVSGSGVTVADRLITMGADGVSIVVDANSTSLNDAGSSDPKSTQGVVDSYSSSVQQSSAAPSDPGESAARRTEHEVNSGLALLTAAMLFRTIVIL